jgi:hydroxymethylpyrimidine pyrophosphatase-like HAD family hydrolase
MSFFPIYGLPAGLDSFADLEPGLRRVMVRSFGVMVRTSRRFRALAVDYDDTLATNGAVNSTVLEGLNRLKASDRRLLLVTGRQLEELRTVGPNLAIFDRVVAENGALLYRPDTGEEVPLGAPPGDAFVSLLRRKQVTPLSVGRVIVATRTPQEIRVLKAIRELGLELDIIFNKGAVMVLPSGVNKASGLKSALHELKVPPERVVGVGDAENDHAFLDACGFGVAVANAVPSLKAHAKLVTAGEAGEGVLEVIDMLMS